MKVLIPFDLLLASPAEVSLAPGARHLVASVNLLDSALALRALLRALSDVVLI